MKFRFEQLEIWQEARQLVSKVYKLTKKFPVDERYGLTDQLRRASVSIALNIAEGTNRRTDRDRKRFFEMSITSVDEVVTALYIALDQGYINNNNFNELYEDCAKQTARTAMLIRRMPNSEWRKA